MILIPFEGKRLSVPVDAPIVYGFSKTEGQIQGGSGQDLAEQVYDTLKKNLNLSAADLLFLRGKYRP